MSINAFPFRRLLALTTAIALVPVFPAAAQNASDDAAPPARVGQIAAVSGSVSFNGSGSGGWAAATPNYPVSTGDALYTQAGAQAAVAVDSSTLTLAENTELQVTGLTDSNLAATASQGELFLDINDLPAGESYTIATPRGSVTIAQDGQYDIAAGDQATPTTVTVFAGAATVTDPGADVQVAPGQSAVLTGTDQTVATLGQAAPDEFARARLARRTAALPSYAPPAVNQMTGTHELSRYGDWSQDSQYGAVWYPNVGADWAPYREGHWADVQPWGWTWVDAAPWGFAPFHYGRWIDQGGRWGWCPAPDYRQGGYGDDRPVYAPAVVSFFGIAVAAGITADAFSRGSVGWVPLGPNEAYYPNYRASPDYIRRINVVNVRNVVNIHENNYYGGGFAPDKFANRRGATAIPAEAMGRGAPVARDGHPFKAADLDRARPIDPGFGQAPAGPAGYRLPPPAGLPAQLHPGRAPAPDGFGQRRNLPPAVVGHAPAPPGAAHGPETYPGQPNAGQRPGFGSNPGFHAPPPPPAAGQHPGVLPPLSGANDRQPGFQGVKPPRNEDGQEGQPRFNQTNAQRPPAPPAFHPNQPQGQIFHPNAPQGQMSHPAPAEAARPPMPRVFTPQQPRPPQFQPAPPHPEAPHSEAPRPPPQEFHPQAPLPQFRPPPQMQQPRPEPQPRPAPPENKKPQHPN